MQLAKLWHYCSKLRCGIFSPTAFCRTGLTSCRANHRQCYQGTMKCRGPEGFAFLKSSVDKWGVCGHKRNPVSEKQHSYRGVNYGTDVTLFLLPLTKRVCGKKGMIVRNWPGEFLGQISCLEVLVHGRGDQVVPGMSNNADDGKVLLFHGHGGKSW